VVPGNRHCEAFTEVQLGGVLNSTVFQKTLASFCGGRPCPDKGKAIVMSNDNGKSDVTPTESETTCTVGNFSHAVLLNRGERPQRYPFHPLKRIGRKRRDAITPTCTLLAESMEERGLTKENTGQLLLDRTQSRNSDGSPFVPRSRGLLGIRQAAQRKI